MNLPEGGARVELRWWRADIEILPGEPLSDGAAERQGIA
jgi:hypothetical protein